MNRLRLAKLIIESDSLEMKRRAGNTINWSKVYIDKAMSANSDIAQYMEEYHPEIWKEYLAILREAGKLKNKLEDLEYKLKGKR